MDCQFCNIVHVVGPYVLVAFFAMFLVAFFAMFLYRIIKRHHEALAQIHARTMDVFERQNATYERVHFDLVAMKKGETETKDVSSYDASAPKKR
jgi:hypothetical protein